MRKRVASADRCSDWRECSEAEASTSTAPTPVSSAAPATPAILPVTSFSDYGDTKPRKTPVWFALDESRLLFAFAGIWRPRTGVRGPKRDEPVPEEHRLFSFLTTDANGVVGPVHPKAIPVLLTTTEEWRTWLEAPAEAAL